MHPNLPNYVAHTQARRHQENLRIRAAVEARKLQEAPEPAIVVHRREKRVIRIGRPGYNVVRQRDPRTGQKSLLFEIEYPELPEGVRPRHRFMSAFEQKKETPDPKWQYLIFAGEPYENIAFKVPSGAIDKRDDKYFEDWDPRRKVYTVRLSPDRRLASSRVGHSPPTRKCFPVAMPHSCKSTTEWTSSE